MDIGDLGGRLATATRILVREHMIGPFGHPSARVPGTDLVAILGHTHDDIKDLALTDEDDIVVMDLDGEVVAGRMDAPGERFLHTEIYRARPDVQAVVHAHPMHCIAFSIAGVALRPIWHLCTVFAEGIPVHGTSIQVDSPDEGRALASVLGDKRAVLLKGHGVAVVGTSLEDAVVSAVNLERSARLQLMVESLGEVREIPRDELNDDLLSVGLTAHEFAEAQWDYWALAVD